MSKKSNIDKAISQIIKYDGSVPKTFVAAMSGGVDSAVAAALYHKAGHKVIGITLQLYKPSKATNGAMQEMKSCCGGLDINDAAVAAMEIGFKHYVLNYQDIFKERVIDSFVSSYLEGETPNPCILCNDKIKFADLLTTAKQMSADGLITGHYLINHSNINDINLLCAKDEAKDQSYFLYNTKKEDLPFLRFPLGSFHKHETREMAKDLGLAVSSKSESQDICFIAKGKYSSFIKNNVAASKAGLILDKSGNKIGEHDGIHNFTIGQRRGIKLGGTSTNTQPLYVISIDAKKNNIVVGSYDDLAVDGLMLKNINWLAKDLPKNNAKTKVEVKYRSNMKRVDAQIEFGKNNLQLKLDDNSLNQECHVHFKSKQHGIAKGQACVFYQGDKVLGGGLIYDQIKLTA